jgi:hypothetical protein
LESQLDGDSNAAIRLERELKVLRGKNNVMAKDVKMLEEEKAKLSEQLAALVAAQADEEVQAAVATNLNRSGSMVSSDGHRLAASKAVSAGLDCPSHGLRLLRSRASARGRPTTAASR